jgi:2-(1,2-epoxy-1,2-dihydrophenyl)acetyl-CoA isomerase
MFTGDLIGAQAAAEMGMINSVSADDELMNKVMGMAERLAQAPTAAIARIKMMLEASAVNDYGSQLDLERETQIESGKTRDFVEGVSAFLEKRPPRFVGG